jgi:3-oxoacyl-[acyl-carrier protein] reductase
MKSALITGASRGIGRGIAESLAKDGYGLTITSRTEGALRATADDLRRLGAPSVVHRAADMADITKLDTLVALHEAEFDAMDALIINAGVGTAGRIESIDRRRVEKMFTVNFHACLALVQASLPVLKRAVTEDPSTCARVVALASSTGVYVEHGLAGYGASKAALISLMEALNLEESGNGIGATAIAPGYVETDMSAWATSKIPAEAMIRIEDVVGVVRMILNLRRTASITKVVMTRSGGSSYSA